MGGAPNHKPNARTQKQETQTNPRILRYYQNTHAPDMQILEHNINEYIKLRTAPRRQKYIQKYIGKAKQRKNIIRTKIHAQHIISRLLNKWQDRKLEHDARKLQQEVDKGNLIPICQFQRALKGSKKQDRNYTLKNSMGT